jgi:NADP-dependent aldehyde dehydrogenase
VAAVHYALWREKDNPVKIVSSNPAEGTQRVLDIEETSTESVIELAERARDAAQWYAAQSLHWRSDLLGAMAVELERDGDHLVELALFETALPRPRLEGELRRTAFQLRFFASVVAEGSFLQASIDHATDSPMGPLPDLRRWRVPLGPVAVFGSSNFPFAFSVPGGDTASAFAAGCPVVVKAHPAHPATSEGCYDALQRAVRGAGAPEGLLAIVYGFEAGKALVDAPAIAAVGFTGSVAAGRALWQRANARPVPIPFFGELGSANPLVVTRSGAVRSSEIGIGVAESMTLGVGQFCTKPGLIFVPNGDEGNALVAAIVETLEKLSDMTMLSVGIATHFRQGVNVLDGLATTRLYGDSNGYAEAHVGASLFEVSAGTFAKAATTLRDECFGPVALVIRYDDVDDLRGALEVSDAALTFSLFVGDSDRDEKWILELAARKAGRVIVNGYPTGVGVSWSMQHGGPWPSTTNAAATSVGAAAIDRWLRPVTYQGVPEGLLPAALRDANSLGISRRVDGVVR